ncbi:MAG: PAS domain-containing protein [Alphaproteobacteria bacterium]|nr:PAS domain-containing protein [Alphaproteobacteria bacterium]
MSEDNNIDGEEAGAKAAHLARLALLPEENPNPVMIAEPSAKLIYANPAAGAVSGLLTKNRKKIKSAALQVAVKTFADGDGPPEANMTVGERIYHFEMHLAGGGEQINIYGRDISERVATEKSLRENRARFEGMAQNSPALICLKDLDGRYIFANRMFQELHGLTPDQIIGRTVYDLFDQEIADPLHVHDQRVVEAGAVVEREQVVSTVDGNRIFMEIKFPIHLPPDGSVAIGLIGTDITDRKRAGDELQRAKDAADTADALLMDALDNMSEGIVIYDKNNRLVLCNRRFREFYRYSEEEAAPGTLFEDLIGFDLEKGIIADATGDSHIARRVEQRDADGGSLQIQLGEGRWLQIRDRRTSNGGTVSIQTDITKRKAAELALRESEATLQTVIDSTPAIINVKDAKGRFLLCNPAQAAFYGLSAGELRGKLVSDVAEEDYAELTMERDRQVLDTGASMLNFEDTSLDQHGNPSTWYTTKVPLLDVGGTVRGILTISHDITQRKDEEVALVAAKEVAEAEVDRQREAMAQAEKMSALGSLLANVSHELNNPLSVVIGQADILAELVSDEAILKRVGRIKSAADRSAGIVRTFLATVRQQPPERSPFDATEPAFEALKTTEYGLKTSGIEVTQDFADGLPALYGDPGQIGQVLANLMINAQQALLERPQPRKMHLTLRPAPGGQEAVYVVSDNGPGIPDAIRTRIFEPFFTTKSEGSGTGIGLPIAHNIVTAHGGSLTLGPATKGQGATFELRLPAYEGEVPASEPPKPKAAAAGNGEGNGRMRVLVVDDEVDVGETVADHLTALGYSCEVAENGASALDAIETEPFDFILSDIRMPVLDGPGLFAEASRRWPGIENKFGFITGDTLSPAASRFLQESGAATIDKPFTRTDLQNLVKRVLRT